MKPRLAAIDLDGTLLHSHTHQISPGNHAAVARALAQGVSIVLASGRQHETIAAFAAELHIPEPTPIISYNGALVRTLEGVTLRHQPVPAEAAKKIVQFCAENHYHLNYYLDDLLYIREKTHWSEIYQQRTGSVPHAVGDLNCFDGRNPTKLLLIDTNEVTNQLLLQFQDKYGDALYITKTEDEYLEFMDRGVGKGNALDYVAAALHISQEDCVAFGDSYNDVSMLKWAALAVVMSSGRPEAKAVAGLLAPPADQDGVGVILDQLLLPRAIAYRDDM